MQCFQDLQTQEVLRDISINLQMLCELGLVQLESKLSNIKTVKSVRTNLNQIEKLYVYSNNHTIINKGNI